jgi:hypothetical protein
MYSRDIWRGSRAAEVTGDCQRQFRHSRNIGNPVKSVKITAPKSIIEELLMQVKRYTQGK